MKNAASGVLKAAALAGTILLMASNLACGRTEPASAPPPGEQVPRTSDGKPDFSGIWQALTTASWDIEDHSAESGVPGGQSVVEGGSIPYQPWALEKKKENYANRQKLDPLGRCFMPGVPRVTYLPFPFQIVQTPQYIGMFYEYGITTRMIFLDGSAKPEALEFWMGDSHGQWEGDTLAVDVTLFTDRTWFDKAGNFHSDALHVVERYSYLSPNHLKYEATIEDPKVFTRPWKISLPLYRRLENNIELLDYECLGFIEPSPTLEQYRQLAK
jgi:hypothetical protein